MIEKIIGRYVCINNSGYKTTTMTIGKVYELTEHTHPDYPEDTFRTITSDDGIGYFFNKSDFMPIDEWRELQLSKLDL